LFPSNIYPKFDSKPKKGKTNTKMSMIPTWTPTSPHKPKLTSLPVDESSPLTPTKAFFICHLKKETHILDLTPTLPDLFSPKGYVGLPESGWAGLHLEYAKEVAGQSEVILVLRKENLIGTDVRVVSYEGAETGRMGREVALWKRYAEFFFCIF
jgi:hypothetical protein